MDKPNKTDNAEQPADTADTEGGVTAEKPRSRHRKTSIAHIATCLLYTSPSPRDCS